MAKEPILIRVDCMVDGHEDDWIEYDTGAWTLADMREQYESAIEEAIARWVEPDSTAWHLTGDDGLVVSHPGRGAPRAKWMDAYRKLGSEGIVLRTWLGFSPYRAGLERTIPSKKSEAGSEDMGEGGESTDAADNA